MTERVADEPFVQEFRTLFTPVHGLPAEEVSDVAVTAEGTAWAATGLGLARLRGDRWRRCWAKALVGAKLACLAAGRDGDLWIGGSTGVTRFRLGSRWRHWWGEAAPTRWIYDLAPDAQGGVWAVMSHENDLATRDVWHLRPDDTWEWWKASAGPDPTAVALDGEGRPHVVCGGAVMMLDSGNWRTLDVEGEEALTVAGAPDGAVWVGTAEGALVLRGGAIVERIGAAEGMPVRGVRGIAFGPDGDVWFAHPAAVSRRTAQGWRYYSPDTWVPGDCANAIAVAPDGAVWMAGAQGVARIEGRTITLQEKAALLDRAVPEQHLRDGYVCDVLFTRPDDAGSPRHFLVSDNDGLWTAEYAAAQCFRYAVTRDPEVKAVARACLQGLMRLVEITERPGFFARSMFRTADESVLVAAGEWHLSRDGNWVWKGDTSSDEMDGHMFLYGLYHDLVADDDERARIAALVSRLVGGVVDNGYVLRDLDGEHTRWGVWSPELLTTPQWAAARKLNSMEMLSYLRSALHMTGEGKFRDAYRELVEVHGYADYIATQQMATPLEASHKYDDDLAVLAYYPLIRYEEEPSLRAIYLDSLARFWEFVRPETNPFHVLICNALLERRQHLQAAVEVLRGHRMDHTVRAVVNQVRQDLEWRQAGRRRLLTRPLPGPERAAYQTNQNLYESERRAAPGRVRAPTPFLLPYWLGRYHGLIE